ncbi:CD109 antigen-like [Babylonia areolata]|uniref:CD109 antigen-like n=1 Tax=Babylonia areolata TaxID=304850 RepID=UPI003FD0F483
MTNPWPLRLLLCSCLLWTTAATGVPSYFLTFSRSVMPGNSLAVGVHMTGHVTPVHVRLEIMDYDGLRLQPGQSYVMDPSETFKNVSLPISKNLKRPESALYLRMMGSGGMTFDHFETLNWKNRRISLFLQTDKKAYKPGETMRFRALSMLPNTSVTDEFMEVTITDPLSNKVAYFSRQGGQGIYVLEGEMPIPSDPRLGNYRMKAKVKGMSKPKNIPIEKYDSPDFEVLLWVRRADYGDKEVTARVFGKYLIGTPVNGTGTLTISVPRYPYYYYRNSYAQVEKSFKLDGNGTFVGTFNMSEIKDLFCKSYSYCHYGHCHYNRYCYFSSYRPLRFTATVNDGNSHHSVTKSKDIRLSAYKFYLRFSSSSPYRFKPGLPLSLVVEDVRSNGKPNTKPRFKTLNFTVTYRNSTSWSRVTYYSLVNQSVQLDEDTSTAQLRIDTIPKDARYVYVKATNGKFTTTRYLSRYYSYSDVYLHLELNKDMSVGKQRKVTLMSNKPFANYTYAIYSKGKLVKAERVVRKQSSKNTNLRIEVNQDMAPRLHLLCYFTLTTREIVAAGLTLDVHDYTPYDLLITIDGKKNKKAIPGEKVSVKVQATKNATVFLLGRHDNALTQKNDITVDDMLKALLFHDSASRYSYYRYSAYSEFSNSGVGLVTNMRMPGYYSYNQYYIPRHYRIYNYYYYYYPYYYYYGCHRYSPMPNPPVRTMLMPLTPAQQVEKLLPDNWLWQSVALGGLKARTFTTRAPDTITKLSVSAFVVHPQIGLVIGNDPATLETKKKMFVSMYLVDSAVRGEVVCFNAIAHNVDDEKTTGEMKIEKSDDFDVIRVENVTGTLTEVPKNANIKESLGTVEAGVIKAATFCIKPKTLGDVEVRVVFTGDSNDEIKRTINIRPEGIPRTQTYSQLIEVTSKKSFSQSMDVSLLGNRVDNSYRMSIAVSGDPLGLVADNIGDLLRMPVGSGEQNLINMAASTHLINYLKKTKRLSADLQKKARDVMQACYHQQLIYQRYDGSFSAFGNHDTASSVWVTAHVVKTFSMATALGGDYINIEPDIIRRAVGFTTQQQRADGSFTESGGELHSLLQGRSAASDTRLTAFVAIALAEAENNLKRGLFPVAVDRVRFALPRAVEFLEGKVDNGGNSDAYTSCIVAYALALSGSAKAGKAISQMNNTAVTDGDAKYWSGHTKSENIEMTSFALLALVNKGQAVDAMPVFRWLNRQRGANGGFVSTKDTALGVQALSAMTNLALGAKFPDINVKVTLQKPTGTFKKEVEVAVTKDNALLPQRPRFFWATNKKPGKITVDATSAVASGKRVFAFAQVVVDYNVEKVFPPKGGVRAKLSLSNTTATSFKLTVCVTRKTTDTLYYPLIVTEVDVPTGYQLNKTASTYAYQTKAELDGGKVVMYHRHNIDTRCSTLKMEMVEGKVAYVQAPKVRVYNAYNPSEEHVTTYTLKQYGVCAIKSDYTGCS